MKRMANEGYVCGFAGLLGWTNVGKSTLVNRLTGMKIAITADSPQTTRHRLMGIVQSDAYQVALIDTPGLHQPRSKLSRQMIQTTWGSIESMDCIVWLVFPDRHPDLQFKAVSQRLSELKIPVIIAVNKTDKVSKETLLPAMARYQELLNPHAIVPISALTGHNVDALLKVIVGIMPENPPLFPEDQVTDQSERVIAAEMIREKVIEATYQELPHVSAVLVESFKEKKAGTRLEIHAVIHVEKRSQKGIVLGKNGAMIKQIGINARQEIAEFFGMTVDLQLWVKVTEKWRNDPVCLRRMGF